MEHQTNALQKQILSNVDSLQQTIIQAKKDGTKNKIVKNILDEVFPRGGLPSNAHYCVAGAVKAKMMCNDSTLNAILPNPSVLPKEYGFASSPNVSCPFMRQFFEKTLGDNYAQKGDENFKDIVENLEAGDVITIKSSANTSTGEHCVTVAGPMRDNGNIPVMSLNSEDNYDVSVNQIIGAAKVMAQYREMLTKELIKTYEETYQVVGLEKYMSAEMNTQSADYQSIKVDYGKNKDERQLT